MAALLVALAVLAVLMSVAMPVWRHEAQREKEAELVFRGQQYIRAIRLYHSKTQTFPPSIDVLVQGRYIRKKFKDPITAEDFLPIPMGGSIPGQGGQPVGGGRAGGGQPGAGGGQAGRGGSPVGGFGAGSPPSGFGGTVPGGMMGVMSKSKEESIRLYQGRNHYNEWAFIYVGAQPGGPGGRGQPGGGPGGRGQPGRGAGPGGPGGPGFPGGPGGGGRGPAGGPFPGGPGRGGPVGPVGPGRGGRGPIIR
jgi:type II secretory pathway pseudopilin PulG